MSTGHRTYTGNIRLLIVPHPDAEALLRVWNTIEELIGVGQVLNSGPTRDASGLEMVLDLSKTPLSSQVLLEAFPGAQLRSAEEDRLTISLPRRS
jgi:hypothetical protein